MNNNSNNERWLISICKLQTACLVPDTRPLFAVWLDAPDIVRCARAQTRGAVSNDGSDCVINDVINSNDSNSHQ